MVDCNSKGMILLSLSCPSDPARADDVSVAVQTDLVGLGTIHFGKDCRVAKTVPNSGEDLEGGEISFKSEDTKLNELLKKQYQIKTLPGNSEEIIPSKKDSEVILEPQEDWTMVDMSLACFGEGRARRS